MSNTQKAYALVTSGPLVTGFENDEIRGRRCRGHPHTGATGYEHEGPPVTPSGGVLTAAINRINAKQG